MTDGFVPASDVPDAYLPGPFVDRKMLDEIPADRMAGRTVATSAVIGGRVHIVFTDWTYAVIEAGDSEQGELARIFGEVEFGDPIRKSYSRMVDRMDRDLNDKLHKRFKERVECRQCGSPFRSASFYCGVCGVRKVPEKEVT